MAYRHTQREKQQNNDTKEPPSDNPIKWHRFSLIKLILINQIIYLFVLSISSQNHINLNAIRLTRESREEHAHRERNK